MIKCKCVCSACTRSYYLCSHLEKLDALIEAYCRNIGNAAILIVKNEKK
jgi:hypothetical protein